MRVTDALASGRYGKDVSGEEVQAVMAEDLEKVLAPVAIKSSKYAAQYLLKSVVFVPWMSFDDILHL